MTNPHAGDKPTSDYHARAGMYRLLLAYATHLTPDPKAPAVYRAALDAALADEHHRDIVNYLAGTAFAGYLEKCDRDPKATVELIVRELRAAEDLAGLNDDQNEDKHDG